MVFVNVNLLAAKTLTLAFTVVIWMKSGDLQLRITVIPRNYLFEM